jgi:hypothetical protein
MKENKQDMLKVLDAFDKALIDLNTAYNTDWRNSGIRYEWLDPELERLREYEDVLCKVRAALEQ